MREAAKQDLLTVLKLLLGSAVLALAYPLVLRLPFTKRNVSDGLSVAAMLLLAAGLFRLVNRMGQFDSLRYGFKKLVEVIRTKNYVRSQSRLPSLAEYKREYPYQKKFLPCLAVAALDAVMALLLA